MEIKLLLIFLGILLIVIGYNGILRKEHEKTHEKKEEEDPMIQVYKNAGIGTSDEILKQTETWESQFEQKPGEIFDNIFNGKIVGLMSS